MATKLIRLEDGTIMEVDAPGKQSVQIAFGAPERVDAAIDKIKPIIINAIRPLSLAWKEISQEVYIEQAEVEFGLSFEGEGNIYITKARAGANLNIKLTLKSNK